MRASLLPALSALCLLGCDILGGSEDLGEFEHGEAFFYFEYNTFDCGDPGPLPPPFYSIVIRLVENADRCDPLADRFRPEGDHLQIFPFDATGNPIRSNEENAPQGSEGTGFLDDEFFRAAATVSFTGWNIATSALETGNKMRALSRAKSPGPSN